MSHAVTATLDQHAHHGDYHHDADGTDVFGFWLYIMTDCILFASLFATFIVLNYQGMPLSNLKKYIDLKTVLIETMFLLASNFTFCLAILSLYHNKIKQVQFWLASTFVLGASFVYIEVSEFIHMAKEGFRWDLDGQASSFFTLVGTHGFHVSCGLLWILIMIFQLPLIKAQHIAKRRLTYLGLFWNFLDIVWILYLLLFILWGLCNMHQHDTHQPDYGTGQKKLSVYVYGVLSCLILTFISFGSVMVNRFSKWEIFYHYLYFCIHSIHCASALLSSFKYSNGTR